MQFVILFVILYEMKSKQHAKVNQIMPKNTESTHPTFKLGSLQTMDIVAEAEHLVTKAEHLLAEAEAEQIKALMLPHKIKAFFEGELILSRDKSSILQIKPFEGHLTPGIEKCVSPEPDHDNMELHKAILVRDNHTCQDCGHYSVRHNYVEVRYKNGDPEDHSEDNLEAVCHFCHAKDDLLLALKNGASLVALDMPQTAISRMSRFSNVGRKSDDQILIGYLLSKAADRALIELGLGNNGSIQTIIDTLESMSKQEQINYQNDLYNAGLRVVFPKKKYHSQSFIISETGYVKAIEGWWGQYIINIVLENNLTARFSLRPPMPIPWN